MSRKSAVLLMLLLTAGGLSDALAARTKQPVDWVDPMLGTASSRWMLYPGPSTPFSMVKLSPDNQKQSWKAGYEYTIDNIAGFSHLHS
ncbi:MAG: GH92 family glycosyl hydrolase, partial [Planctomycetota bacterium]